MICFKASSFPPTKVTTSGKLCFHWQEEICPKTWFSQNQSILPQNFFFQLSPKRQPDFECISIINVMKWGRHSFPAVALHGGPHTVVRPHPEAWDTHLRSLPTRMPWLGSSMLWGWPLGVSGLTGMVNKGPHWFYLQCLCLSGYESKLAWC